MAEADASESAPPASAPVKKGLDFERISKLIGVVAAAAGLLVSVGTFLQTTRKDVETRRLTARGPFLKKQQELYVEIVRTGALLATKAEGSPELAQARQRFLELFYGELSLVEDEGVEAEMFQIKECLDAGAGCSVHVLRERVLRLTVACRKSLAASWGVPDWIEKPKGDSR